MLGRKSLVIVLNNVLGAAIGFLALNFIAGMPERSYGYYVWASSTIGIYALVTALGFHQAHIKRVSEGMDEARANGTYFLVKVVLTLAFVVLTAASFLAWRYILGKGFTDSTTEAAFLIVLVIYTLLSFRQFYDATFQAHRHTARGESVMLVDTIATFVGIATAFYIIEHQEGSFAPLPSLFDWLASILHLEGPVSRETAAALIAVAYLGGKMVSLVYSAIQFHLHKYPLGRPSLDVYRDYRAFGLPMAIVGGITVLYGNIDRFLLGVWYSGENVERFQVPYQVLTPMLFVAVAVSNLLFPSISSYSAAGDTHKIVRETRQSERYMSMIIVPQIALAFVFAKEGMHIFNDRYVSAAHLVQIFCVFVYFTTIATPARSILLGTGQMRRILRLVLANLAIILVLNLVLVPPFLLGMAETGAALVIALVSVITYAMSKRYTLATTGGGWLPDGAFRHLLAGAVTGFILFAIRGAVGTDHVWRLYQLAIVGIIGGALYLGLLVALREFRRTDWDHLRDLIHPKRLAGYVGDELTPKSKP